MMVCGFFTYADLILNTTDDAPPIVPFLHSNQSTIEASFSCSRAANSDNARDYGRATMLRQCSNVVYYLDNNPMYKGTTFKKENHAPTSSLDQALKLSTSTRDKKSINNHTIIQTKLYLKC